MLGKSHVKSKQVGEAEKTFNRLRSEYPESSYSHKIPKLPEIPPDPELEPNPGEEEPTENAEDDSGAESDS